jgi:hypothetical protein
MANVRYGSIWRPWDRLELNRARNQTIGEWGEETRCGWMAESRNLFCDIEWHLFSLYSLLSLFPLPLLRLSHSPTPERRGEENGWIMHGIASLAPKSHHLPDRPRTRRLPSLSLHHPFPAVLTHRSHRPYKHPSHSLLRIHLVGLSRMQEPTFIILVKIGDRFYRSKVIGFSDSVDNFWSVYQLLLALVKWGKLLSGVSCTRGRNKTIICIGSLKAIFQPG